MSRKRKVIASAVMRAIGSDFTHVFTLYVDGRVTRSTIGNEGPAMDCGIFPEMKTKEDLLRKAEQTGYREVPNT